MTGRMMGGESWHLVIMPIVLLYRETEFVDFGECRNLFLYKSMTVKVALYYFATCTNLRECDTLNYFLNKAQTMQAFKKYIIWRCS